MRMKIVPHAREVHIEDIPTQLLASIALDGWRVAHKRAPIQAEIRSASAPGEDYVVMIAQIRPVHLDARGNRDHLWIEKIVFDRNVTRRCTRCPAHYVFGAIHRRTMNLSVVLNRFWTSVVEFVWRLIFCQPFALKLHAGN